MYRHDNKHTNPTPYISVYKCINNSNCFPKILVSSATMRSANSNRKSLHWYLLIYRKYAMNLYCMRKTALYCMLKRLNNTIDIYSEKYKDVSVPDQDKIL